MEKWKTIEGASRYEISTFGRIRNVDSGLILKHALDRYGYEKITLVRDDGSPYYATVHRLVAIAWVEGKGVGLQVNHKDGLKTNNRFDNLEWVTVKENIIHSYETLLNKNVSPVLLIDLEGSIIKFRSIKQLSMYLKIHIPSLMPLIKYSPNNPIFGKYIIQIVDIEQMVFRSNTKNFGRPVYVFDEVHQKIKTYPSVQLAAYHTGLRCLSNLPLDGGVIHVVGYICSFNKDNLPITTSISGDDILFKRYEYVNSPYVKRNHNYYLYDYYTGEEWMFEDIHALVDFFNTRINLRPIDAPQVSSALGYGHKDKRSGILRGMGVKSSRHDYDWYPYWEEVIITNRLGTYTVPVYRIESDHGVCLAIGKKELCIKLGFIPRGNVTQMKITDIVSSSDLPNLKVTRLNKPLIKT